MSMTAKEMREKLECDGSMSVEIEPKDCGGDPGTMLTLVWERTGCFYVVRQWQSACMDNMLVGERIKILVDEAASQAGSPTRVDDAP